jgi:hypothetical protein
MVTLFFVNAVLRMKHSDGGYSYNHTLAHILVEYASAVSSCSKFLLTLVPQVMHKLVHESKLPAVLAGKFL